MTDIQRPMIHEGNTADPLDAIKALGAELTAAKQGVRDAFERIRDVKSRIAAAKKALAGITKAPAKKAKPGPGQTITRKTSPSKRRGMPRPSEENKATTSDTV